MNETQTVTIPIQSTSATTTGTYPGSYTVQVPYLGPPSPWPSGGSGTGVTSWPMGGVEAVVPKKPRKPRTKKVLLAHEQEMKDAEAKWKKILDGEK